MKTQIKKPEIDFSEDGHTYQRKSDGKFIVGVTTVLNVLSKPYLIPWATKENYKHMKAFWDITKTYTEEEKEELLVCAKNAYRTKADKAKDAGSIAHSYIEQYIKSKIKKGAKPETVTDPEALNAIKAFLVWEKEHDIKWLASEMIVASETYEFAGTLDALAYVDKKLTLIDFKTSKQISIEYYLQTAAYQIALEEMGLKPEQRLILRIPKDGKPVEAVVVSSPLEFDKETFLRAREIHKWFVLQEHE